MSYKSKPKVEFYRAEIAFSIRGKTKRKNGYFRDMSEKEIDLLLDIDGCNQVVGADICNPDIAVFHFDHIPSKDECDEITKKINNIFQ